MSHPHRHPHRHSYLSILSWPAGFSHDDKIEALVASVGMDPEVAQSEAGFPTPGVLAVMDVVIAEDVLRVLHGLGVLALAIDADEMSRYPIPELVKRIARFPETSPAAFAVDDNDEPAWTFTADQLRLVVAGKTRSLETRTEARGPRYGMRTSDHSQGPEVRITKSDRVLIDERLDLHLVINGHPRLLRLTGRRTLIRSLEEIDARPSLLNPPDPIELLEPYIEGVKIDLGFEGFTPPLRFRMLEGAKSLGIRYRTPEAFGFYSVWSAMVDRAMRGD